MSISSFRFGFLSFYHIIWVWLVTLFSLDTFMRKVTTYIKQQSYIALSCTCLVGQCFHMPAWSWFLFLFFYPNLFLPNLVQPTSYVSPLNSDQPSRKLSCATSKICGTSQAHLFELLNSRCVTGQCNTLWGKRYPPSSAVHRHLELAKRTTPILLSWTSRNA